MPAWQLSFTARSLIYLLPTAKHTTLQWEMPSQIGWKVSPNGGIFQITLPCTLIMSWSAWCSQCTISLCDARYADGLSCNTKYKLGIIYECLVLATPPPLQKWFGNIWVVMSITCINSCGPLMSLRRPFPRCTTFVKQHKHILWDYIGVDCDKPSFIWATPVTY